jgi:hypothetical protein
VDLTHEWPLDTDLSGARRAETDFCDFVAARSTALFRGALVLTGNREAAEDLVQEALERAWSRWRTFAARSWCCANFADSTDAPDFAPATIVRGARRTRALAAAGTALAVSSSGPSTGQKPVTGTHPAPGTQAVTGYKPVGGQAPETGYKPVNQ